MLRQDLGLEAQLTSLQNKLYDLGTRYLSSGRYLPVPFLTEFLEKVSCHMQFEQHGRVVNALADIGTPLIDILNTYDQVRLVVRPKASWFMPTMYIIIILTWLFRFIKIEMNSGQQLVNLCIW